MAMEKLEKIEKLRERAQVSYDEAREAYDHCDGDLLEALIYLEKQGKVKPPKGDGFYRSEDQKQDQKQNQEQTEDQKTKDSQDWSWEGSKKQNNNAFKETLQQIGNVVASLIKKGNDTSFEVLKDREHMASFPVTVLVLLLIFAPWVTLPLLVIGLFFGFHYQFVSMDD